MTQKQETVRSQKLALLTLGQPFQSVVTMTRTSEHVQTEAGRTPPGAVHRPRVWHTPAHTRVQPRGRALTTRRCGSLCGKAAGAPAAKPPAVATEARERSL